MVDFITLAWAIILAILFFALLLTVYLGTIRNSQVFNYRMRVLCHIREESTSALGTDTFYEKIKKYDILLDVSYHEMVIKFWRPVDSFFPEEYRGL